MPRHGLAIFHFATEHPGDDELDHEDTPPPHHPDPDGRLDEKDYLRLMAKKAEAEGRYWLALLHDDHAAAQEASALWQRLDKQVAKFKPESEQEPDSDE
jgi:hypothetical protein